MPKVSIIVPFYNVEKYIEKCLQTLVNQTLEDIEIILVNDGSKDNTIDIVKKYQKEYPQKIIYLEKENGGLSDARNYAIPYAKGEYIAFLDSDDYVETTMYQEMYEIAKKENSDMVECNFIWEYPNKSRIDVGTTYNGKHEMLEKVRVVAWNKLIKREILEKSKVQFPKGCRYEDVEFTYKLIPYLEKVSFCKTPMVHYIQRIGSITNIQNKRNAEIFDVMEHVIEYYKKNNMYTEYYTELEYVYVRYAFCSSFLRIVKIKDSKIRKELLEMTWNKVYTNFPDWKKNEILNKSKSKKNLYLKSINKIFIVACGTAMHAGLMGKSIIEKLCRIPVEVDIASEFRYRNPIIDEKTLCIFVSQSGETADTLAALRLSKLHGARTLAISNVIGSTITREADYTIYTHAGPEIAVASTKAYTSQVCLIAMLGIYFAELLGSYSKDELEKLKADILDLPSKIEAVLDNCEEIKTFASKVYTQKDMFFLGRGTDYNVALEGSLKLKEISYIHSEAYAAGELKHGPIALIENGVTVIGIITNKELVEKTISNMQEVITRGAKTLIITNQILPNNNFGYVINIPETNELISPILSVIPLQLLSYYISKNKGLDVDKPRNLAKSVTVE